LVHERIVSTCKITYFVGGGLYIALRSRWFDFIVLMSKHHIRINDDSKENFREELEHVFYQFRK
jgi:hypothetical protein